LVSLRNGVNRRTSRISAKLVASVLALAIVFLSLAVYSVEMGRQSLEKAIGTESVDLVKHFALSVDRGIYTKLHEMIIISMGNNMRNFLTASNAEFDAMEDVESYIDQQDDEWTAVPLNETSPFMEEMLMNNLSVDLINRLDDHYIREHGMDIYGEAQVSNEYGALVAMTTRSADYRQNDEAWWQETVSEGRRVSEVEMDPISGTYGISISVVVTDADDMFLGVMKAFVGTTPVIMEAQFETSVYETTEIEIVTADKRLVYSTHAFTTYEDVSSLEYVRQIDGDTGYFVSEEGERERLYSYSVSPGYIEYEGSTWIFLMSHDAGEVLEPVNVLRSEILTMSTLLLLAFLAIAFLLSTHVTIPVHALKKATERMATGHLDERVAVKNKDELGDLAQAFNAMASQLDELYADLEAKVQERTKELGTANDKLKILGSITRHDALNQLSVLRGWLSVLEEDWSDENARKYFAKVLQSADVLEAQLKFTGMYEKIGLSSPQWVDAKLAVDTNMPGLDLTGVKVLNRLQGLEVLADQMFPRVLRNLAENAVRHGEKTTRITFSYEERSDGLAIIVEDDGVGVPDEMKTLIFERVRDKTTGRAGFGLYLSRAILAITDIVIRETGQPGEGARFEIIMPKGRYRLVGGTPARVAT
jgi:signal transduction histidine kinase